MTEREKIREYLIGMANAACCNKQTAKDIKEIIIPHIDSMQEEPVSEDLDRFAEEWDGSLYRSDAVKAGAHWLLNKLMNKAINTTVVNDWTYGKDPDKARIPAIHERIYGYDIGNKVKVIILKNE